MAGGYNMAGAVSRKMMRRKQDELWMAWEKVLELKERNRRLEQWVVVLSSLCTALLFWVGWRLYR